MLRILRNASVHHPLLRCLLKHFYVARNAHLTIDIIDSSFAEGNIAQLTNLKISEAEETEFDNVYYAINDDSNYWPNPEIYIIINGQPTESNNVWRSLVDANKIKAALRKLKEINWLYRSVDDDSIDESSKNVIKVVSITTCKMLEKANDQD
uniref:Uncharacterized protein n=1 Tax=Amphimedon queenslandica TaxID=400682 RepID=A0A1X7VDF4_AMPQE